MISTEKKPKLENRKDKTIINETICCVTNATTCSPTKETESDTSTSKQLDTSASSSHKTRASKLCKLLPKKPSLQSKTVINLFLNACNDPNTKDLIMDEMSNKPKFKNSLSAVSNKISEESKIVHKTIRRAYALKSKGFKKRSALQRIVSNIRSKYSFQQVQAITGMTYRQVYRLIGPPKMSSSKWLVTDNDR